MLRTTLTKIKKAWALALASRGRGDIRGVPGKFHKLIAMGTGTEKSTSADKNNLEHCEKCKRLIDYIFGPNKNIHDIKSEASIVTPVYANKYGIASQSVGKDNDAGNKDVSNTVNRIPIEDQLRATSNQAVEQLEQKVESIEETPLVEAESKEIDGVIKPPRVVGYVAEVKFIDENNRLAYENIHGKVTAKEDNVTNIDMSQNIKDTVWRIENAQLKEPVLDTVEGKSKNAKVNYATDNDSTQKHNNRNASEEDVQNSFEAIAKRCLDAPTSRIDERLLKEMKQYGIPQIGTSNCPLHKDVVNIGVMQSPRKPVDKNGSEFETTKIERGSQFPTFNNLYPVFEEANSQNASLCELKPLVLKNEHQFKHDKKLSEETKLSKKEADDIEKESRPVYDPIRPITGPYDKRSLASKTDTFGYSTKTVVKQTQEIADNKSFKMEEEISPAKTEPRMQSHQLENTPGLSQSQTELFHSNHMPNQNYMYYPHYYPNYNFRLQHWQEKYANPDPSSISKGSYDINTIIDKEGITRNRNPTAQPQQNMHSELSHREQIPKYQPYEFNRDPSSTEQVPRKENMKSSQENIRLKNLEEQSPQDYIQPESSKSNPQNSTSTTAKQQNSSSLNATPTINALMPTIKEEASRFPTTSEEQFSNSFVQQETIVNPETSKEIDPADIENNVATEFNCVPKPIAIKQVSLTEMLKRVRIRNRLEYCKAQEQQVDYVVGKCGKKTPPCPPPAPKCSPAVPRACPPAPPPCPRPCKPSCPPPCVPSNCPPKPPKCPCDKFTNASVGISIPHIDIFTLRFCVTSKCLYSQTMLPIYTIKTPTLKCSYPRACLTYEVKSRLQCLGRNLLHKCYRRLKFLTETGRTYLENITLARDFEPWVPIPSWPIPKQEVKKPLVCPKEGCKLIPPPRLENPCAKPNDPCLGFPKRRNFSLPDMFYIPRTK